MARTPDRRRPARARKRIKVEGDISYLDIQLLSGFLTERGKIKSRSQTGLSRRQQSEVARAVKRARELSLLPYVNRDVAPERRGRRS